MIDLDSGTVPAAYVESFEVAMPATRPVHGKTRIDFLEVAIPPPSESALLCVFGIPLHERKLVTEKKLRKGLK